VGGDRPNFLRNMRGGSRLKNRGNRSDWNYAMRVVCEALCPDVHARFTLRAMRVYL